MKEIIQKTSKLCKIDFNDKEQKLFESQFTDIIDYISVIEKLPIEDLEPLAHLEVADVTIRKDESKEGVNLKEVLKNAPSSNENFFKVPKQVRTNIDV